MKKINKILTILAFICIMIKPIGAEMFGPYEAHYDPFIVELYSVDCTKVTEFEAFTVVIPEDFYLLYHTSDIRRMDFPGDVSTWKLEGIYEIRIIVNDNLQWFFIRNWEGKLEEKEASRCGFNT